MAKEELWYEWNTGDDVYLDVEGFFYARGRSLDRLTAHRETVVKALERKGADISEYDGGLAVSRKDPSDKGLVVLLDELAVLNRAIAVSESKSTNLQDIADGIKLSWYHMQSPDHMAEAYDLVSVQIPQLVGRFKLADKHNGPLLKTAEKRALDDLLQYSKNKERLMNAPGGYVVLGFN